MATLVKQLQSKAVQASHVINKHGSAYYKELLEKNKHHVVGDATVEKCQELSKQLFYTRLARLVLVVVVVLPTLSEMSSLLCTFSDPAFVFPAAC